MRLPEDWTAVRRPGYGEIHHLIHTPCGWRSPWPVDLAREGHRAYRQILAHETECAATR